MTHQQLSMMEEQLQVSLPTRYKDILCAFPWPEFIGGTDFSLWDDAALNIERTLEYRSGYGGAPPWPVDYVHIGDDEDACPYALHCSDGTIVKTDHGNLTVQPLSEFANIDTFVSQLQDDLDNA